LDKHHASDNGLPLFLDRTRLLKKLETDEGFGGRFYLRSRCFLPIACARRGAAPGTRAMDELLISRRTN
jgi:hypothetical protein